VGDQAALVRKTHCAGWTNWSWSAATGSARGEPAATGGYSASCRPRPPRRTESWVSWCWSPGSRRAESPASVPCRSRGVTCLAAFYAWVPAADRW